jgi:hypothetical protein
MALRRRLASASLSLNWPNRVYFTHTLWRTQSNSHFMSVTFAAILFTRRSHIVWKSRSCAEKSIRVLFWAHEFRTYGTQALLLGWIQLDFDVYLFSQKINKYMTAKHMLLVSRFEAEKPWYPSPIDHSWQRYCKGWLAFNCIFEPLYMYMHTTDAKQL